MSTSLVAGVVVVLVLLALAGGWVRQVWTRSAGRKQKARRLAEREKADDLRDCRVAHESLVRDPAERAPGASSSDPEASGDAASERSRAQERWQRAYSTSSKLDPDLPADRRPGG